MATISLDPEAMEQLSGERKTLLDAIDSLRKHGIKPIDLPQIVVFGDQWSGKSSVLDAISRIRFPVKDGLCTRFATELVLRTDPQTKLHVHAQPAPGSTNVPYTFSETSFDKDDLPRIVEKAKTRLLQDGADFSEDVLRIEICSPDVPHLTLVDLPGIDLLESQDGSAPGRKIVRRLVESYMVKQNSIILAVVSADNQDSLETALSEIQSYDKNHDRILGIITKPDLLIQGSGDEFSLMTLTRNRDRSHRLALGWHILRNRSDAEGSLSSKDRDVKEQEFFDSGIWPAIPANNRGADALREKIADVLMDHTRNKLDTIVKGISDNLNNRQKILKQLGEPRSSPRQLRMHLDKIASQFQLLSLRAIEGNYSDEFFGGLYPDSSPATADDNRIRKLRALVRDLNRTFAYILLTKGSRRIICPEPLADATSHEIDLPPYLQILKSQYPFSDPQKVTRGALRAELEPLLSINQGNEFPGTTNDLLAVDLFRDQSRPWEEIARFHIDLVLRIAKSFTEKLMTHVTGPDPKTCSAILLNIVDPFFEKCARELEGKLQELLYNFRSGYAQPLDAEFRPTMERHRRNHLLAEAVQKLLTNRPELFTDEGKKEFANLFSSSRNGELVADSLIDMSETYYELSLRTFTDNVITLAVENCLIKDLPMILTTSRVSQMDDDELERLAAESADVQVERAMLRGECEALKKVLDICKPYRARNLTVLLPTDLPRPQGSSPPVTSGLPVEGKEKQPAFSVATPEGSETSSGDTMSPFSKPADSVLTDNQTNTGPGGFFSTSSTSTSMASPSSDPVFSTDQTESKSTLLGSSSKTGAPIPPAATVTDPNPGLFPPLATVPIPFDVAASPFSCQTRNMWSSLSGGNSTGTSKSDNNKPTSPLFGSSSSTNIRPFGTPSSTSTVPFGTPSSTNTAPFGANTGGLFSSRPTTNTVPSGAPFSKNTGLFGAQSIPTSSLFGAQTSTTTSKTPNNT